MIEYLPDLKALAASIERRHLGLLSVTDEAARARAEAYMAGVHDALHALQDAVDVATARGDLTP